MIRIAITAQAYAAIEATMPLGSVAVEHHSDQVGGGGPLFPSVRER
jgi:hypothetical protein